MKFEQKVVSCPSSAGSVAGAIKQYNPDGNYRIVGICPHDGLIIIIFERELSIPISERQNPNP